jgi:Ca-activated chloride channel family protein
LVPSLVLVALLFSTTASAQEQRDSLLNQVAPRDSTSHTKSIGSGGGDEVIVNTDLISFNVTVTDKSGHHIPGLPRTAFTILDEKRAQEISFFGEDDSPISVVIVFDLTASMTGEKVRRAREAIARFMETSHKDDEYFLITLQGGGVYLALDSTRDHQAVIDKLTHVAPRGATALYDACYLGVNKVLQGTRKRRAMLLISDGLDNNSRYTFEELHTIVKESDVAIYSIGVGEKENNEHSFPSGKTILESLAAATGGKFFQPQTGEEMYDVFERIALELRFQYTIGYKPSNFTPDGRWHDLKVKINPPPGSPRLSVRYRSGYYALATPR